MARLIDADALTMEVASSQHNNPHTNGRVRINHHNEHDHFMKMIFDAPTVEAVEVVRCKECKYHDRCEMEDLLIHFDCIENPYCAAGERRTDV